jgi:hypothetical protein
LRRKLVEQRLCLIVLAAGDIGKRGCELEARIVGVEPQRFLADGNGLERVDGLERSRPFLRAAAGERIGSEFQAGLLQGSIIRRGSRFGRECRERGRDDKKRPDTKGSSAAFLPPRLGSRWWSEFGYGLT